MKNKLIKKLSNITMLFAILFNLVLTVNAATAITTNSVSGKTDTNSKYVTNKGTLKVTNLADENDRLTAYKILDTFYNEDKESISYEFTSDFKTIAEYFYQTRHQQTWFQPSSREVNHPHELSALMSELTQNTNWLYLEDTLKDEDNKMSNDLLAKMMARSNEKAREEGISIGLEKGRGEGREENREEVLLNMLRDNMPIEKITQYLNLTKEKVEAIGRKYQLLK